MHRIFVSVITLLVISYLTFNFSSFIKNDPVDQSLARSGFYQEEEGLEEYRKEYRRTSVEQGKHLSTFYFKIAPSNYPSQWSPALFQSEQDILSKQLNQGYKFESLVDNDGIILENYNEVKKKEAFWYLPKVHWYGVENQYHLWMYSALKFDFGLSIVDGRPVSEHISEALPWTISLGLMALLLSALISIPLGTYVASFRSKMKEDWISTFLYGIHSIPVFWLATLLVVFFTTEEYGSWTNLFPSVGIRPSPTTSEWYRIMDSLSHLILPVFCLVIHSLAFDIIQIKASVKRQFLQDYVITTKAKGVGLFDLFMKHILRNALIPMITIFVIGIPVIISGAIVVETIYNIPGMGRLLLESLYQGDWNIVMAIVLLSTFVTIIAFLLGDLLYAWANPKIRLSR